MPGLPGVQANEPSREQAGDFDDTFTGRHAVRMKRVHGSIAIVTIEDDHDVSPLKEKSVRQRRRTLKKAK
jgi:hypothetical protein